jgi:hypothetical protein
MKSKPKLSLHFKKLFLEMQGWIIAKNLLISKKKSRTAKSCPGLQFQIFIKPCSAPDVPKVRDTVFAAWQWLRDR